MLWITLIIVVSLCLIALFIFSGPNMSRYDSPIGEHFPDHPEDDAATARFLKITSALRAEVIANKSPKKGLVAVRKFADELSDDLETETQFVQTTANGVEIEWAIAPNTNPRRRVLFMHGGAFIFGSPKGHRKFSDRLAKMLGAAVASVDYRMLPENRRMKSVIDSQLAYQWILEHGPDGKTDLDYLLVSGDSAGGNLALMLSSWSKSMNLTKPNAVVAFSPSSDMTLSSPTIKSNRQSDKMLGEGLGLLAGLPKVIALWVGAIGMRVNPANPLVSPLFGDLSDLPPTLIHASSNEMLLGESVRYTNKARESGSMVSLQIWQNQVHDWHLFNMGWGSAENAWAEVEKYLNNIEDIEGLPQASSSSDSQAA